MLTRFRVILARFVKQVYEIANHVAEHREAEREAEREVERAEQRRRR